MSANVVMPKLGMTMAEGTVARWLKQEGQQVDQGTPVLEIETEKIVYEIESPISGVLHISSPEGSVIPCGGTCGTVAASQSEYQSLLSGAPAAAQAAAPAPAAAATAADGAAATAAAPATSSGDRVKASPAAKRLAGELGVDIASVQGSGPEGRIVEEDVKKFAEEQKAAPAAESERIAISPVARKLAEENGIDLNSIRGTGPGGRIVREDVLAAIESQTKPMPTPAAPAPEAPTPAPAAEGRRVVKETVTLTGIRKAVAEHMVKSLHTAAQLTVAIDVDATELVKLRKDLVAEADRLGARISYNDLIVRAIIKALKDYPIFNSSMEGNEVKIYENVNMGIAVNTDDGLVVPVVHNADKMSLIELSKASSAQIDKARNRTLGFGDITEGTFTISNIGAFDVVSFTPILNSPESAIIGVGGIAERPAVVNGQIAVRSMMSISLTWDHRVTDGVPAVQFVQTIKNLIERPSVLLV